MAEFIDNPLRKGESTPYRVTLSDLTSSFARSKSFNCIPVLQITISDGLDIEQVPE